MYQTLIWAVVPGDESGGLAAAFDAEDVDRAADALVDGVRGDVELSRDFLGRQVLVNQPQAIELAHAQPRNAARDHSLELCRIVRSRCRVGHPSPSQTQSITGPEMRPSQQYICQNGQDRQLIYN